MPLNTIIKLDLKPFIPKRLFLYIGLFHILLFQLVVSFLRLRA